MMYPHLDQGKRVSPLVNSQQNLNSVEGGETQDQQIKKTYCKSTQNLSKSNSEN